MAERRRIFGWTLAIGAALSIPGCTNRSGPTEAEIQAEEIARQTRIQRYIDSKYANPPLQEMQREDPQWDQVGGNWVFPKIEGGQALVVTEPTATIQASTHNASNYVVFTGTWEGRESLPPQDPKNPGGWYILDVVERPDRDGNYSTKIDFTKLGIKGEVTISFDVIAGSKVKEAPNGYQHIRREPAVTTRRSLITSLHRRST